MKTNDEVKEKSPFYNCVFFFCVIIKNSTKPPVGVVCFLVANLELKLVDSVEVEHVTKSGSEDKTKQTNKNKTPKYQKCIWKRKMKINNLSKRKWIKMTFILKKKGLTISLFLVQKLLAPVKLHNVRPFTPRLLQKYRKKEVNQRVNQIFFVPPFSLSSPSCFCQCTNRPTSRAAAFVPPSAARRCPHMKPIVLGWLNGRTPLAAGHCFCFTLFTLIKNCHSGSWCSAGVRTSFTGGAVHGESD